MPRRTTTLFLLLSSFLLTLTTADTTLHLDLIKNPAAQAAELARRSRDFRRRWLDPLERRQTVSADLGNAIQAGLYYANITVGTPPQSLQVQIDTGSSDTWVPAEEALVCQSQSSRDGCIGGSFDNRASSTFAIVGPDDFNISYVDGSGAAGDYFHDSFSIGGASIENFQMGLGTSGTIGVGILGIGYNVSVANVFTGNGTIYANLPNALANAGLVRANAYSLWLNDLDATTGNVLFGGIDTKKYEGDLISVQVYPEVRRRQVTSFTVAFTSLSATSSSGTDQLTPPDYAVAAILDSGTTLTILPDDIAEVIFSELGASPNRQIGAMIVPCSLASNPGTLNYGFGGPGGPVIKVAMSQLVLDLRSSTGRPYTYSDGRPACRLGIQAAGDLPILFGDTFLRSAYAVYDLDNNRVALAQTDFNETESEIVPFASMGAPIPSAKSAPNEEQVTQSATSIPKVVATQTEGAGATSEATYNPTATGLNAAAGFAATGTAASSSGSGSSGTAENGGQRSLEFNAGRGVWVVLGLGLLGGGGVFALF